MRKTESEVSSACQQIREIGTTTCRANLKFPTAEEDIRSAALEFPYLGFVNASVSKEMSLSFTLHPCRLRIFPAKRLFSPTRFRIRPRTSLIVTFVISCCLFESTPEVYRMVIECLSNGTVF